MFERTILHSDLNNFYANVECSLNPALKDKAVVVCGDPQKRHGIVLAKNQLAKSCGIKTGDVIWQAQAKCRDLVILMGRFDLYLEYSRKVRQIYERWTDRIESFGIDECWLDVTSSTRLFGSGEEIANKIRESIRKELNITASIGVSFNKIFAKLGSDLKKPDATTVISPQNFKKVVFDLPVQDLLYVGRATSAKLIKYNIKTIGELACANPAFLRERFGKWGEYLWAFANGFDDSSVRLSGDERVVKSVGNSTTSSRDLSEYDDVNMVLMRLCESVAERLRSHGLKGRTVTFSARNGELEWVGKQATLLLPSFLSSEIFEAALGLFKALKLNSPLRSVGVTVSDLSLCSNYEQLNLFLNESRRQKRECLEKGIDKVRSEFGAHSIVRATMLLDAKLSRFDPKSENVIHPVSYF